MNTLQGHQLAEERVTLSSEYATLSEELGDILTLRAAKWAMFRSDSECKSDKAADRKWESTPEGLREMRLRLKMKAMEKQIAAIGSMLRVLEAEGRNQF